MKSFSYLVVVLGMAAAIGSCGEDGESPLDPLVKELAKQCGIGCPGDKDANGVEIKGVLDGNAAISGVASVDAFFAAVNNFRGTADNVSAGIEAQIAVIKADFGLAANANLETELKAKVSANLEGNLEIDYQPAQCSVDARATFEAKARCEAEVTPPMVELECAGSCEAKVEAKVSCDAEVSVPSCTFTGPTVNCQGECSGTCEAMLSTAASCSGTCRGTCTGACSAYSDEAGTQCAGSCSGMCMGSCEVKAQAGVKCMGTCKGECKVSGPDIDCNGAARASCDAKGSAKVKCQGKCEGDFTPPKAKAECEASAKAEARLNVQCTPPRLAARYRLKAVAAADVMAQARFEAALRTLVDVRLPALLQATTRGKVVAQAGEDLAAAAGAAVKTSIDTTLKGDLSVKALFGLRCALGELPDVSDAVQESGDRLTENLNASVAVGKAFGINNI